MTDAIEPKTSMVRGVDRRPVTLLSALFLVGLVGGLVELVTDQDQTSTGASVATANWMHVGLAVVLVATLVTAYRRDSRALVAFLSRPVSDQGWASLLNGLVSLPLLVWELVLAVSWQPARIAATEDWRGRRILGIEPGRHDRPTSSVRPLRVVVGAPLAVLAFVAAVVSLYAPLRAGEQVFGALDPDFTRDAWGGPSYPGAFLAHWMDVALVFYACSCVLALAAARRRRALAVEHA
jgi:hypothetical protein